MTALFLNLHASFWNVYKVDLEGNKNMQTKVKQYSCEKKLCISAKFKVLKWFSILLSF